MARIKKSVAVLLTPAEQDAIVRAAAEHEAAHEGEGEGDAGSRAVDRALDHIIAKINHARKGS